MNKYRILYYDDTACCYNSFFVLAESEEEAKSIFQLKYPNKNTGYIEYLFDFNDCNYNTRESIEKEIAEGASL